MDGDQDQGIDTAVRAYVYDKVLRSGILPSLAETAAGVGCELERGRASFQRLADGHILVLQKGSGEILMANPFSAVPTAFQVHSVGVAYHANCIWDAMGVAAMLGQEATIQASCACCGTAMALHVKGGRLLPAQGIVHFAIPAMKWWEDIVFT